MKLVAALTSEPGVVVAVERDRDWVASEFAAIMHASGFGDRVIVGTLPPAMEPRREAAHPVARRSLEGSVLGAGHTARVRSPPAR